MSGLTPASLTRLRGGRIAVIDFETTGMSPLQGDRATEIALVMVEDGRIVDRFQSLMRTGVPIPYFITGLTGITQSMVESAPPAAEVMWQAMHFVGDTPMVAHNASFDSKFWNHELALAGLTVGRPAASFACTVLLSRRLYPGATSHKLGNLARYLSLPSAGRAHRAMADAQVTAALLVRMQHELHTRWGIQQPDHALLAQMQRCKKAELIRWLSRQAQDQQQQ